MIATAITQRLMVRDDLFAPDDAADAVMVWLLASVAGVLWLILAPLGLVALAARALQRWYDARLSQRKDVP